MSSICIQNCNRRYEAKGPSSEIEAKMDNFSKLDLFVDHNRGTPKMKQKRKGSGWPYS